MITAQSAGTCTVKKLVPTVFQVASMFVAVGVELEVGVAVVLLAEVFRISF